MEIFGVSADSVKAQKSFCDRQEFPFSLLSDPSKETIKAYGAWGPKKFIGRSYEGIYRKTFVIENNKIVKAFEKVKTNGHSKQILEAMNEL